uniref:EGF domain-specific O-linked N-acetylglucosamine transferase n=1 Tax=Aceria tosichella TaxID=561515 RepID=A0A6G1SKC8_9ACAR
MFKLDYGKQVLGLICSKITDVSKSCWGYENNCQEIHLMPECHGTDSTRAMDDHERKITWFSQADFGYILDRAKELSKYCAPDKKANPAEVSSFECTKHFTTCRGNNLYARFNTSILSNPRRNDKTADQSKVLIELGGWNCDLQAKRIKEEAGLTGRLQSWYGELGGYDRVDHLKPIERCEFVEERQVFFVKINSTNNLDDYLSTFINLYATIHLNNRFSEDNQIYIWNRHLPRSKTFEQLWYAFSRLPPRSIGHLDGSTACFKKFIFAMPPNMVDGLHTDKPLIEGCSKSGLYNAFHKHIIHRLKIPNVYDLKFHRRTQGKLVRIAILSRASKSEFRNILNEHELEKALKARSPSNFVRVLKYNSMDFSHVLLDALNSDIMIGIHGTGLAYSLFLPDWAGLIELHDCNKDRYKKLSRLRGIGYFKPDNVQKERGFMKKIRVAEDSKDWSHLNQSRLLDHDEFSNYEVDIEQFMELFTKVQDHVLKARDEYFKKSGTSTMETLIERQPISNQASATEVPKPTQPTAKPQTTTTEANTIADTAGPATAHSATKPQTITEVPNTTTNAPTMAMPASQTPSPRTDKVPTTTLSPTTTTTSTSEPKRAPGRPIIDEKAPSGDISNDSGHNEL